MLNEQYLNPFNYVQTNDLYNRELSLLDSIVVFK